MLVSDRIESYFIHRAMVKKGHIFWKMRFVELIDLLATIALRYARLFEYYLGIQKMMDIACHRNKKCMAFLLIVKNGMWIPFTNTLKLLNCIP